MPRTYELSEVNLRIKGDPKGFVEECEALYDSEILSAAKRIAERASESPIVLLSGPSGSGKTTSSLKLEKTLEELGVGTHPISLDDYFNTVDEATAPKAPDGSIDYESPMCLDMELLNSQIKAIWEGKEVMIPKFDFKTQSRSKTVTPFKLHKDEVVIFEGIHALNDMITDSVGEHGIKLYISSRSNFTDGKELAYKGTWTRLTRRIVRDILFRDADAAFTLKIWDGIRRGEKEYISPFKGKADISVNSTHGYEVNVLKKHLLAAVKEVPKDMARYDEACEMLSKINAFADLDDSFVPKDSLLREFIGGGSFTY